MVWIFYYGSEPTASHRRTLDAFALHKEGAPSRSSRYMSQHQQRPDTLRSSSHQPQMYNANQLAGFETSSPVTGFAGGAAGQQNRASASAFPQPASTPGVSAPGTGVAESQQQTEFDYPYRAKAIYSYEANPDDSNEVSFAKHEVLEVSDVSGRWWQAKKENGDKGIIPSNYVRYPVLGQYSIHPLTSFPGCPYIIVDLAHKKSVNSDEILTTACGDLNSPTQKAISFFVVVSTLYASVVMVTCGKKHTFPIRRGTPSFLSLLEREKLLLLSCHVRLWMEWHAAPYAAGWPRRLTRFPFLYSCSWVFETSLLRTRVTIPRETILRFLLMMFICCVCVRRGMVLTEFFGSSYTDCSYMRRFTCTACDMRWRLHDVGSLNVGENFV
jgi:hypothetical protein